MFSLDLHAYRMKLELLLILFSNHFKNVLIKMQVGPYESSTVTRYEDIACSSACQY